MMCTLDFCDVVAFAVCFPGYAKITLLKSMKRMYLFLFILKFYCIAKTVMNHILYNEEQQCKRHRKG